MPRPALRHRPERITPEMATTIETTMPARISYFDAQGFVIVPVD